MNEPTIRQRQLRGISRRGYGAIGGRALIGSAAGLVVFDLRDPTQPKEVGRLGTRGVAQGLFVFGAYLFMAIGQGSAIVDVSDPRHPAEVQFLGGLQEDRQQHIDLRAARTRK